MTTAHSVTDQMQNLIDSWKNNGDRREIFLSCYAMMTTNMFSAIETGDFEDNPWVSNLLNRFAGYYFNALTAYETEPASAPTVWQIAFNASRNHRTHVLQNLSLGVNAHINYDLVFALSDLLAPEWSGLTAAQQNSRYRDHCHVNTIIYQTIDAVQDQVVERYDANLELADRLMGPLDEWLTSRLITDWREQVWKNATHLLRVQAESDRQLVLQEVERRSLERARSILGESGIAGLIDLF
jgi:hypothetical protein